MDGVEVAVELKSRSGSAGVEADDDGGRGGMSCRAALDSEAVGGEDVGQSIKDGAGLAGATGDGDEIDGGLEHTPAIDGVGQGRMQGR
jgi:hypothetical protein